MDRDHEMPCNAGQPATHTNRCLPHMWIVCGGKASSKGHLPEKPFTELEDQADLTNSQVYWKYTGLYASICNQELQ